MPTCQIHGAFRTLPGEERDHCCPRCGGYRLTCDNCGLGFTTQEPKSMCGGCEMLADADDADQLEARYEGSVR